MTIDTTKLMHLGMPFPLAAQVKTQVDADVATGVSTAESYSDSKVATLSSQANAQRDILAIQSAVAATGTDLAGALATTGDLVYVSSTSASSNDGVKLRAGTTRNAFQWVINRGTSPLKVYPPSTAGKIDGLAAGAAATLSNGQQAAFWCVNPTNGEYFGKY